MVKRAWIVDENGEITGMYVHVLHRVCKDYECKKMDHVIVKYYATDEDAMREENHIYKVIHMDNLYFRGEPNGL